MPKLDILSVLVISRLMFSTNIFILLLSSVPECGALFNEKYIRKITFDTFAHLQRPLTPQTNSRISAAFLP